MRGCSRSPRQIADGNGTLLDHLLFLNGSGNPNVNDHTNLPSPVAGGTRNGMTGARHIKFDKSPRLANLHLTLRDKGAFTFIPSPTARGSVDESFEQLLPYVRAAPCAFARSGSNVK